MILHDERLHCGPAAMKARFPVNRWNAATGRET